MTALLIERSRPCARRGYLSRCRAEAAPSAPGPGGFIPGFRCLLNLASTVETIGRRPQALRDGAGGGPDLGPEPPEPLPGCADGRGGQADHPDDSPLDPEHGRRHAADAVKILF